MKPLYSMYTAVAVTALAGICIAVSPQPARSGQPFRFCGTVNPTPTETKNAEYRLNKFLTGKLSFAPAQENVRQLQSSLLASKTITIRVYFHVITTTDGKTGNLTDAQIQSQVNALNTAFSGKDVLPTGVKSLGAATDTGFRFVLAGIDRTANDDYFLKGNGGVITNNLDTEKKMKTALRRGTARDLNVYTNALLATTGGVLGYATFPQDYATAKDGTIYDGIVMDYNGLPNGPYVGYQKGTILVHEVGHWVGLYHTFQGSCSQANDYVTDTPAEAGPYFGDWFPGGDPGFISDTCTGRYFAGKDPNENYMDYSYDESKYRFSAGQTARMKLICKAYRGLQ